MKSYPYIYSLSTIGLIHHYNNDYLFNRTRTDFTGDSGTGKSMIADLLQLVFVGSKAFEAATDSLDDKRKPKGMVLNDKKIGLSGKGYVFLNIAVTHQQYLVMGMYLEHSTNLAKPFIIYKGYDIENPDFLNAPLLHETFLNNQAILPIENLKEYLEKKDLNCETMQLGSYHKFLFNQEILPFDLADNPDKLKTYALIIQSFSRGKGFKFDTKHLQEFLFGTSKEDEILSSYKQQIENIQSARQDSLNYQSQIVELKKRRTAILNLITLDNDQKNSCKNSLNAKYIYLKNTLNYKNKQLKKIASELLKVVFETTFLEGRDNEIQVEQVQKNLVNIEKYKNNKDFEAKLIANEKITQSNLFEQKTIKLRLEEIERIMPRFDNSIEKLKDYYSLHERNKKNRNNLISFSDELHKKGIRDEFELSEWKVDYEKALMKFNERITQLNEIIETNKALLNFSNVEDKKSISHWALNRKKAFSKVEESVLIAYKELIVSNPENITQKYLLNPEELFQNIDQTFISEIGFWINLNGIYEYVPIIDQQFLESDDPSIKKKYFKKKYKEANQAIVEAKKERRTSQEYHDKLHDISGLKDNIALYSRKSELESFTEENIFTIDKHEFDKLLTVYKTKDEFLIGFQNTKKIWETAHLELTKFEDIAKEFSGIPNIDQYQQEQIDREENLIGNTKHLQRKIKGLEYFLFDKTAIEELKNQQEQLLKSDSLAIVLSDKKTLEAKLRLDKTSLNAEQRSKRIEIDTLTQKFQELHLPIPLQVDGKHIKFDDDDVAILESDFVTANNKYQTAIDSVVSEFLAHDRYKYENEHEWDKIAKGLLPEVFKSKEITEDLFSSEIEDRLQSIIDKNKVIGDRKVQLLLEVFSKVEDAFTLFSTEIDRLKSFFNDNDKRITGGHKVVIKLNPSADYPIDWIDQFKKQMREENLNRTGLFQIVNEAIDFKEIIQRCFKQCGGKKSDPKLNDLLNPKKYFELSFNLQKDNVKNSGSTGQVYSAIALLCIARISLIEQGEGKKKRKGVRFMPVDEAEGLGSNYEMLSNIAKSEDYQIVSMSINPVGEFEEGSHYIYMLNEPEDDKVRINGVPFAQFTEVGVADNIQEFIVERYDG